MEQMNQVVENISFESDEFWGERNNYKFRTMISSFETLTELPNNSDRVVRTQFDMKVHAYLLPESQLDVGGNKGLVTKKRYGTKKVVTFTEIENTPSNADNIPIPPAPTANFTAIPTSGSAPLTVLFTDLSINDPTTWAWDFQNDGIIDSTQQNPTYTYTSPGVYDVKLTVSNAYGSGSVTKQSYISLPLREFDYAVIRFTWTSGAGTDLDTRTALVDTLEDYDDIQVGWCRYGTVGSSTGAIIGPPGSTVNINDPYYLFWGGDNTTSTGPESHLLNFPRISQDFPTLTTIKVDLRAFWYSTRESGDITIEYQTYLGGTMQRSGVDFINVGGTVVDTVQTTVNVATSQDDCIDGDHLKYLIYDVASKTATIV